MTALATLSRRFRITIPKALCAQAGWKPGCELVFVPKGRGVLMMPAPELADLAGIAKAAETKLSFRDRNDRY